MCKKNIYIHVLQDYKIVGSKMHERNNPVGHLMINFAYLALYQFNFAY